MSRLRATLVRQEALHQVAVALKLGECLHLGEANSRVAAIGAPRSLPMHSKRFSRRYSWMVAWRPRGR